jgi:phosphoribosylformylglycinamidine cyclo-ligase
MNLAGIATRMASIPPKKITYADAGVNIDAGNALVERIKPHAKATRRSGVMGGLGGFGGLFDLQAAGYGGDTVLVAATDGVGTKLKIAHITNQHHSIGIDLVAMCANDLLAQNAEPLFFLDYYACGALSVEIAEEVIAGIAAGCKQAGCALIGGETAEMPSMYQPEEYDLAGFVVGAAPRGRMLPDMDAMQEGDVLLGLASSGVHSNGFSLVRRLVSQARLSYDDVAPWEQDGSSVASSLLTPTKIYIASCLPLMRESRNIKGFAHITGGGLTENLPRILPQGLAASVCLESWKMPPVFSWMQHIGNLDMSDMLRTFNCGIGAVLVVEKEAADDVAKALEVKGERVFELGGLVKSTTAHVQYR